MLNKIKEWDRHLLSVGLRKGTASKIFLEIFMLVIGMLLVVSLILAKFYDQARRAGEVTVYLMGSSAIIIVNPGAPLGSIFKILAQMFGGSSHKH